MRGFIVGAAIVGSLLTAGVASAQGGYEAAIYDACARYGCDGARLVRVMNCESGGDPSAVNPVTGDSGLFQFNPNTYYANGGTDLWNPWEQIEVAARMWANGQGGEWVCTGL